GIDAGTAIVGALARVAVQGVVARPADQYVVQRRAGEGVVAQTAGELPALDTAVAHVDPAMAVHVGEVVLAARVETDVVGRRAPIDDQRVDAVAAVELMVAARAEIDLEGVVAGT